MSLSVIPLTILGQITGVTGSGDTVLYQVSFKSIDGTPLFGVTAVWTDEQAEIEALAAQKPYGVWINPISGTFTVKFAGYTYKGSADLTDPDVLAGVTPIEFDNQSGGGSLPAVTDADNGKVLAVVNGAWDKSDVPYTETAVLFSGTAEVEEISMAYGIVLKNVTLSPETTPVLNLTLTKDGITNSYEMTYSANAHVWIHLNNEQPDVLLGMYNDVATIRLLSWTSENVGDEYTINLSAGEEPTQSFADAVHMVLGDTEAIIWEGDVETTTTEMSGISPADLFGLPIIGEAYIDGIASIDGISEYFDEGVLHYKGSINDNNFTITIARDSSTITISASAACHIVIKKKSPQTVYHTIQYVGGTIYMNLTEFDIEKAVNERFEIVFKSLTDGNARIVSRVIGYSYDAQSGVFILQAPINLRGNDVTWNVDHDTSVITGTFGGADSE